ncbi:hypothetical protein BD413DRAFT_464631 [Trametes elegans]|nr:hypothetical protein BD413DRAFT_464631 [Trametes elegans]
MPVTPSTTNTHASTSTSANATQTSRDSSQTPVSTLTTVAVKVTHSIITTTITTGGSSPLPTVAAVQQHRSANVPVGPIVGGTVAGFVLALAVVIGWVWWGKCIKRKKAKEVKEALAVLQVRENTRKNASSLSHPASQYRPAFSFRTQQQRRVTFVPDTPSSGQSTLKGTADPNKLEGDTEKGPSQNTPAPLPSTPSTIPEEPAEDAEPELPPPVPRRNPARGRKPVDSTVSNAPSAFAQHRLVHQSSTLSSGSVYSTQSAVDEHRNSGVPSSLLLALANEDVRRSLLANYMPWNRHRNSTASQNRLSQYSTNSFYSQFDEQPWEPVGRAYGDEEELMRR